MTRTLRPESWAVVPLALTALCGCLSPSLERGEGHALRCVSPDPAECDACLAAGSADALTAYCSEQVGPAAPARVERVGHVVAHLSGRAHGVPLVGDKRVAPVDVEFEAILSEEQGKVGVELTSRIVDGRAVPYPVRPRMTPVRPAADGAIAGSLQIPIDFAGFDGLADGDNVRTSSVHLTIRLIGSADVGRATGAGGRIDSFHADGVKTTLFGAEVSIDLSGPLQITLDPAPAAEPDTSSPRFRACMQRAVTELCCVTPAVRAAVARRAGLSSELPAPAACAPAPETAPSAQQPEPDPVSPADDSRPAPDPVDDPPAAQLPGEPGAAYDAAGTTTICAGPAATDVACWSNVFRQPIAGQALRGRTLDRVEIDLDRSARALPSLRIEVRLLYGIGDEPARILEDTRTELAVGPALAAGTCTESDETLRCGVDVGGVLLPAEGDPGADWFILELVGRDDGERAPDGSWACGRYPARVAEIGYDDDSLPYGGALQVHRWSGPSCELDYQDLGVWRWLDLGARILVR